MPLPEKNTFCLLFRSPFSYRTKNLLTEWSALSHDHSINRLVKVRPLDDSGKRAVSQMPTVVGIRIPTV